MAPSHGLPREMDKVKSHLTKFDCGLCVSRKNKVGKKTKQLRHLWGLEDEGFPIYLAQ